MNSKYWIITDKDAKAMKKMGFKSEAMRHMQLMELINKAATLRGQDTLTLTQGATIANKLSNATTTADYNALHPSMEMGSEHVVLPSRTGPTVFLRGLLISAGATIVAGAVLTAEVAYQVAAELIKGNITLYLAGGFALVAAAAYGLATAAIKVVRYVSKTSRKIYWKFAQNIEANIVRELDALLPKAGKEEGTEANPLRIKNGEIKAVSPLGVEKLANGMELQGVTQNKLPG